MTVAVALVLIVSVSRAAPSVAFDGLADPRPQVGTAAAGHKEDKVFTVEPGTLTEARISVGEVHLFPITLASEQFLSLVVEQRGVDLVVTLIREEDDTPVLQVDTTNATRGEESLFFVAEKAGSYKVKVQPVAAGSGGNYALLIKALREALPADRLLSAGTKSMAEGDRLRKLATGETLAKAIDEYAQALTSWRQAGNAKEETKTLYNTGLSHARLDDYPRALEFYLPLPPRMREHGTEEEQAALLLNIAIGTLNIGEKSDALTYFEQARQLFERLNIPRGLAFTLGELGRSHYLLGENQVALDYYGRALTIWQEIGNERG
ncbi:MAG TPA: tetratricopeptide repeat protein, partial [Pyrinomonadaceae bacterium]